MSHVSCQHGAYRLSCEDYERLLERSGNACEICRTPAPETTRGTLVIDHDRERDFSAVRGLLCDKCNHLMDRVDRGLTVDERAAAYLRRYVAAPARKRDDA